MSHGRPDAAGASAEHSLDMPGKGSWPARGGVVEPLTQMALLGAAISANICQLAPRDASQGRETAGQWRGPGLT